MSRTHSPLRRHLLAALAAGLAIGASPLAQAQTPAESWPSQTLSMVVPFPPGSSPDLIARTLAEPLAASLGHAIVIENRPGAGGNIGTRQVAQAKPDGNTLLFTINGPLVTAPRLYQNTLGYNPTTDLAPVSLVATSPNVLVVNNDLPVSNLTEFIELVKANPGTYNYGSVGPGSASHLAMEMFRDAGGNLDLLHVPYSGFPQVISAIIAGDVHSGFMVPAIAMPQVESGKARALAISSLEPSSVLPGIEPVAQQGIPDFEAISWQAILVPAGTPDAIVQRLNKEIDAALQDEKVRQLLEKAYFTPVGGSPDVLAKQIESETARWTAVINSLNLSLE